MPRRNHLRHPKRRSAYSDKAPGALTPPSDRLQHMASENRINYWPPIDDEHVCPDCKVERDDWEGPDRHLVRCPACDSAADPVKAP